VYFSCSRRNWLTTSGASDQGKQATVLFLGILNFKFR
jgi:hypothetical protein